MKRLLPVLLMMLVSACATNTRITTRGGTPITRGAFQAGAGDGRRRGWCQSAGLRGSVRSDPAGGGLTAIPSYSLCFRPRKATLPAVRRRSPVPVPMGADHAARRRRQTDCRPSPQPVIYPYGIPPRLLRLPLIGDGGPTDDSTTTRIVMLETNLWQVVGEHLVWSGTTESFGAVRCPRGLRHARRRDRRAPARAGPSTGD